MLMDPKLLDLPLGVKIPVLPGSKPVFSRAKLGQKVNGVGSGTKALFLYGVLVMQRSPCGQLLCSGSCSPSVAQGWGAEGSSWLRGAERKEDLPVAVLQVSPSWMQQSVRVRSSNSLPLSPRTAGHLWGVQSHVAIRANCQSKRQGNYRQHFSLPP